MIRTVMKFGVALCALSLAGLGVANATSPIPAPHKAPFVIPVIDETEAVEEHLEPEVVPPGSQEGGEPERPAAEQPKSDSGDIGLDEVQREYPTEKLPPSGDKY
ncbi:MAG: hypothetical protein MUO37_11695 [Methyloceanibacter sp.]|jgi:hypothetical protein|nr:hypothetical protein [Methyloceanibacter sp.]